MQMVDRLVAEIILRFRADEEMVGNAAVALCAELAYQLAGESAYCAVVSAIGPESILFDYGASCRAMDSASLCALLSGEVRA